MSETGIYAGGYQRVREYAELVDRLLLDLKSGRAIGDDAVEPVLLFLSALDDDRNAPATARVVGALLRERKVLSASDLKALQAELEAKHPSPSAIERLEALAGLLDEERAAMSARLHGGRHGI